MRTENIAKEALDDIIRESHVHWYEPIQTADILFRHRTEKGWSLNDLESCRNSSKRWRDDVSMLLVGRRNTSSQSYQDNIFKTNAMPEKLLVRLGKINKEGKGLVEAYVYKVLENRLSSVYTIHKYIGSSTADSFSPKTLVSSFQNRPGLRRSIEKLYEILVYALFATISQTLKAQITSKIGNKAKEIFQDFKRFIAMVLGINLEQTTFILPAALYRVGITNVADRGLDIWDNFGQAIQVKHLTLTTELVEDITDNITADKIVIV